MDIRLDHSKHDITSLTYATTPEQIAKTKANSLAAFWEHGVAVTDTGCDILDLRPGEEDLLVR